MLSFYPGKHFLNFIHRQIVYSCRNNRKCSLLYSSIIYIKSAGSVFWFGLAGKLGVEVTCWFCSSQSMNPSWFFPLVLVPEWPWAKPSLSVSAFLFVNRVQEYLSHWLWWCEKQAQRQALHWCKLWSVETWKKIHLKLQLFITKTFSVVGTAANQAPQLN